jgi:hypothetical protein
VGFEPTATTSVRTAPCHPDFSPKLLYIVSQTITYTGCPYPVCRFASARYFPLINSPRLINRFGDTVCPTPVRRSKTIHSLRLIFPIYYCNCVYPFTGCFLINAHIRVRPEAPDAIVDPFRSPLLGRWSYHPFRCTVISPSSLNKQNDNGVFRD